MSVLFLDDRRRLFEFWLQIVRHDRTSRLNATLIQTVDGVATLSIHRLFRTDYRLRRLLR